ncbi:MAG: hypothetical protein RLN89_10120 [Parvibaculum sp.]
MLILAVIFTMSVSAGLFANRVKGRRFSAWFAISAITQSAAIALPAALLILLGIINPADWLGETKAATFESFRLLAEMSVVAGCATLFVIAFLEQTRWKTCSACDNQVPWRATACPHCASSQTVIPEKRGKMDPGAYPRLTSRVVHLPVELDRRLRDLAIPLRQKETLTEEAAVSRLVANILRHVEQEADRPELASKDKPT